MILFLIPLSLKKEVSTSKLRRQRFFTAIDLHKIKSMVTIIKTAITINRPVEEVWGGFINPVNLPHWLTGFVYVMVISGQQGAPGSKNKLVLKERGNEIAVTETVQEITPLKHFRSTMEQTQMNSEVDFRLISFGNYTEIIQTSQLFPNGFLMKLLMPLLKRSVKKTLTNDLMKLKKLIEETNKPL